MAHDSRGEAMENNVLPSAGMVFLPTKIPLQVRLLGSGELLAVASSQIPNK